MMNLAESVRARPAAAVPGTAVLRGNHVQPLPWLAVALLKVVVAATST